MFFFFKRVCDDEMKPNTSRREECDKEKVVGGVCGGGE